MDSEHPSGAAHRASAVYASGAVAYGLFLTAMGFVLAGGGHGVVSFFWVGLSGLVHWPVAAAGVASAQRSGGKAVFLSAMSLQYLATWAVATGGGEREYLGRVWAALRWLVVMYVVTYSAGQAVAWWWFASLTRRD
jgi:hypothetical protein